MPDWDAAEYVYVQLADELARLIRDGTYPPGSRLPSEAELAETYEVARPRCGKLSVGSVTWG